MLMRDSGATTPTRPVYVPPPIPPAPPKIETPEQALAQANHDQGSTVQGATHADTQANLAASRQGAVDVAMREGRSGDLTTIDASYDQALARLDADNTAHEYKPETPTTTRSAETPEGASYSEASYADGTRIVQTDGRDPNGNAVVSTQVYAADATGAAALVPLEARTVVVNGASVTTGLPTRSTPVQSPDGQGTVITDTYGSADNPDRVVQHTVLPDSDGGQQVQSVTLREHGVDATGTPPLRIREFDAKGAVAFDTGEVGAVTTAAASGQPGVSTVTHQYDGGYRMRYTVQAAPAGSQGVPAALVSQELTSEDGKVVFESQGTARKETMADDGRTQVADTAADGSRVVYTLGSDGKVATTQQYSVDGQLQQTVDRVAVEGFPVVASSETLTRADGTRVVTEFNADNEPVGIRELAADGTVVQEAGSLRGERIDPANADDIASDILDQGKRTMWRDDYEKRLSYALETMQDMDPVSQRMVLDQLQSKDSGMANSWFKTDILENLSPEQMQVLEGGGLDIVTGVPGTTAADLQTIKSINELDVDAGEYTGEYGELAATGDEQNAGQLDAFMTEYTARAGDKTEQARFVALYERMHGDAFVEGFLSDETLGKAVDGGVSLYQSSGTIEIDRTTHDALMGDRLETEADRRPEVLAARDRVMDTGVRSMWTDDYGARVKSLVTEMGTLDADGQAALVRQIAKEDPDARLSWLRDGEINDATKGNDAFTPEMRETITSIRANGDTTFAGQLLGFGSGVKNAAVGFVVGLGVMARTAYDLSPTGLLVDAVSGGNAPGFLPSAHRGVETGTSMVEGLPTMFSHIGQAWNDGRYGEALGNVTFDVASLFIPLKIPKIRLPGGAVERVGGAADNLAPPRYIDPQGRPVTGPAVEPRLSLPDANGVYRITDAEPPLPGRVELGGSRPPLAIEAAATPAMIAERKATATAFYERVTGKAVDESHLAGIDFTRPVEVQTLREGTTVYQWQVPDGPQGNYFSPSATARPTDIGISSVGVPPSVYTRVSDYFKGIDPDVPSPHVRNPDGTYSGIDPRHAIEVTPSGIVDKVPLPYKLTRDTEVLVSTAKPINDSWAIPDRSMASIPAEGGRLQIYAERLRNEDWTIRSDDPFRPVTDGVDPPSLSVSGNSGVPAARSFADDVAGREPHPVDADLLQIAKHVYKADGTPLPGNFRQLADGDLPPSLTPADFNHSSGLRAGLYTNGEGQFVLAFKGTAPTSRTALKDIYTDAAQGLGFTTAQYTHAIDLTRRAYAAYGDQLVLTGHSLGGGLASQAAMAVGAGNLPAVVFNPAAVHPANLARENPIFRNDGGVQMAPDGGTFANGTDLATYFAEQGGLIRAYIVKNDELTLAQDHIPCMPSALGHRQPLPGNFPIGHTMGPVEKSFDKRFPDGVAQLPEDVGLWYVDPATGQWTTRIPDADGPR